MSQGFTSGGTSSGTDADAIHDNVAGEIAAVTEKTTLVAGDLFLLEDSAASNAKKRAQIGSIDHGVLAGLTDADHQSKSVRVNKQANQSIPDSTDTALTFSNEEFDVGGFADLATNNTRLTVPSGLAGKYLISGYFAWASNTTGTRRAKLRVNGTTFVAQNQIGTAGGFEFMNISAVVSLAAADYVEIIVFQNSGAALDILGSSTDPYQTHFAMALLGV